MKSGGSGGNWVVTSKGKRNLEISEVKSALSGREILHDVFPATFINIQPKIGEERVSICVKPGDTYRVVGLRDYIRGIVIPRCPWYLPPRSR